VTLMLAADLGKIIGSAIAWALIFGPPLVIVLVCARRFLPGRVKQWADFSIVILTVICILVLLCSLLLMLAV